MAYVEFRREHFQIENPSQTRKAKIPQEMGQINQTRTEKSQQSLQEASLNTSRKSQSFLHEEEASG